MTESDNLSDFLNKHLINLRSGNLVIVSGDTLKSKYNIDTNDENCIGVLLSNAFTIDSNKNIYYSKMYKIFILDNIINIRQSDIKEKL